MMITVTESAQAYFRELLDKQNGEILGIRVFVNSPGTPKAETCIASLFVSNLRKCCAVNAGCLRYITQSYDWIVMKLFFG
jgi:uncharacterized protein YneR